jgi:hypothetical protein
MYLPKSGTVFGSTEASYSLGESTLHDDTNGDIADINTSGYSFKQTVGYSILDQLFVSASMNYLDLNTRADYKSQASQDLTSTGISDPSINARLRGIDSDMLLDLLLSADLKTEDSEAATSNQHGNNKTGRNALGAGIEFGKKNADYQLALKFDVKYLFEGTFETATSRTKINPHTAYNIKTSTLFTLTEKNYLNPYFDLTFTNAHNDNAGNKTDQSTRIDLGLEYRYLITQALMLRAGLQYTNFENNVVNSLETREDYLFTLLGGANYQF